jgi:2-dehydropantoate 2-reductase
MNIGIIGGGSIGLLFGAFLLEKNHKVTLYTRTESQAFILNNYGISKEHKHDISHTSPIATCISDGISKHDFIIIAVKQYHLSAILETLYRVSTSTPLLFLQNGMGHIKMMQSLPHEHLFVGVVEHGALKRNENTVVHSGVGITKISLLKGDQYLLQKFVGQASSTLFPLQEYEDWYEMLLSKLVVNAMINPLTAMFRVENGQLIENPHFFELFTQLFDEIVALLQPENSSVWWESVKSVCQKTAKNRSSMLRDIEQSNPTEIDGILGFLKNHQNSSNNQIPLIHFLYNGIKGLEKLRRR